jgi:hypothetical protein
MRRIMRVVVLSPDATRNSPHPEERLCCGSLRSGLRSDALSITLLADATYGLFYWMNGLRRWPPWVAEKSVPTPNPMHD